MTTGFEVKREHYLEFCPHCGGESDGWVLFTSPIQTRCLDCGQLWSLGDGVEVLSEAEGRQLRPELYGAERSAEGVERWPEWKKGWSVEYPSVAAWTAWLRFHGWRLVELAPERFIRYEKDAPDGVFEVEVPYSVSLRDYRRRIEEVLGVLVVVEGRSREELLGSVGKVLQESLRGQEKCDAQERRALADLEDRGALKRHWGNIYLPLSGDGRHRGPHSAATIGRLVALGRVELSDGGYFCRLVGGSRE